MNNMKMAEQTRHRIGLLGIAHESNTFIARTTTWQDFVQGHLFFGEEIRSEYHSAHHEVGGIIAGLDQPHISVIPIMYAEATPGGKISDATARKLVTTLIDTLQESLPLDGLMVVPHGAAVSEAFEDFDGYWLNEVRSLVGSIPIVGTLDLHANVSEAMAKAVDVLVPYATNPHLDQRDMGGKAAMIMLDILIRGIRPVQYLRPSKVVIGIEQQHTASHPCIGLYQLANRLAARNGVLSVGILLGFPYADVYEMGTSFLVVTDDDLPLAREIAHQLEEYLTKNRRAFVGDKVSIEAAIGRVATLPKPVLLLDMGDNVGGGSPGDGTTLLDALERSTHKSFVCIYDPVAVGELSKLQKGSQVEIEIGGRTDGLHGPCLNLNVILVKIIEGKFHEKEARHGGQVHFDMGLSAIVESISAGTIMLTSRRIAPFSLQQLLHCGLQPQQFDVIVAKGVQAPIAAYEKACPSLIRVNTPGVTTADMTSLRYNNRRKPLYPFEAIAE